MYAYVLQCHRAKSRTESIAVIHAALDTRVSMLNTADFYTSDHNEMLIGGAIKDYGLDKIFLSVRFGARISPDGMFYGPGITPQSVKIAYSLKTIKRRMYRPLSA